MKRKALFTLVLGTVLAVAPAARATVVTDGGSGNTSTPVITMGTAEYQALMHRSDALNRLYGNAVTALSPQQFKSLYESGLGNMTPQEQAALIARSQGLNQTYGGGNVSTHPVSTPTPTATGGDSFAWNAAYGAAALTGAMLLVLGFAVANRRRHPVSF
jgi:hypothetical protein